MLPGRADGEADLPVQDCETNTGDLADTQACLYEPAMRTLNASFDLPKGRNLPKKIFRRRYSKRSKTATMNRYENPRIPNEARVRYLDGDYQVETPGTFVRCSVTGVAIPLDELKYWSVERQEAYVDANASMKRILETRS